MIDVTTLQQYHINQLLFNHNNEFTWSKKNPVLRWNENSKKTVDMFSEFPVRLVVPTDDPCAQLTM